MGGAIDVTVGTEYTLAYATDLPNVIGISGTTLYMGTESTSAYPDSTTSEIPFYQQ